jgi:hypothetical protein
MNLKLMYAANRGDLKNERLVFKALANEDVGDFIVLRAHAEAGDVFPGKAEAYWFPDRLVNEGDLVVLYTKDGSYSARERKTGGTNHFFYWGGTEALWTGRNHAAVVAHATAWRQVNVSSLDRADQED